MNRDRDTIFFISDAHFGVAVQEPDNRIKLFKDLTAQMRRSASDLFIVGDLFDFWIEYRFAIRPDYFPVLHELYRLVESGVKVHYLAGNHDFALGPFLEKSVGLSIYHGSLDLALQGRKVHLCHGDGVLSRSGDRITNAMLRNKTFQKLYKIIHPDIGVAFGAYCSRTNRKISVLRLTPEVIEKYRQAARLRMKERKSDLVVFAHTHHGELHKFDEGEYCNTGAWMNHYNYATLRSGKMELRTFLDDK
ncbi:MAG: UDP-2,3-diacylglucosamine diphosphatase [Chitinispirillales bacterium]|jgi:UDP-2,3-diacylglucosamine hydrolase|nr:UDP-2,3-diacylglucosamine diphosphatase [Chitinispirillales bacterium]